MTKPDLSEFRKKQAVVCVTSRQIATLSSEDQEKIQAAFLENDIPTTSITTWLEKKLNVKVSDSSVRKHRKNVCGCDD
jgi:hypothetical protein